MMAKTSPESTSNSFQDALSHNRDLLLALSRAARSIQRARTAVDFYHAVGNEIKSIGGEATLLMVNEDRKSLSIVYTSYSPALIRKAEKLTGLSLLEYRIPFTQNSIYGRVMEQGETVFSTSTGEAIAEILPGAFRLFTPLLMKMFKLQQGILAPLRTEDGTLGLLKINGLFLTEEDVPAMDSFAGQIATGIQNVGLMQKLQDELTAHRQADELLNHNRSLLLALSRAFQTIQQAYTPEDIYHAVGAQIKSLGGEVTLLMVNDDRQSLTVGYISYSPQLIQKIEKLTGSSVLGYRIVFSPDSIYARNIAAGKAEYVHWAREHVFEGLPPMLRPLTDQLIKLLKIEQGILAPLQVEGEVLGLMMVGGLSLNEGDVPAIESFAGQIAAGVLNARLAQQMRDELSARKQAEEAVRQAENRFRALIEKASDGIVLVGLDGKIQYASPSARNMFNDDSEDDLIANPLSFIHPDDLVIVLNAMNDLIYNPAYVPTLEYRYRHKDNTYHWVESTFSNLLAEPSVQAIVINFRDINVRKLVEDALRESERKFHSVVSESSDGIVLSDEKGQIIEFNSAIEQITGLKRESVIGRFLWDQQFQLLPGKLRTDERYARSKEIIQKALETGQSPIFHKILEASFEHADGSMRIIQQRVFSIRTEQGWRLGSVSRDITDNKKVEEALRASEDRYRVLYEDNPSMYFTTDAEGMVLSVNKFGVELLGYLIEEMVGQPLFNIFHPEDYEVVRQEFNVCLQNLGQGVQVEARKIRKNGEVLWVRESARAVHDANRQVVVLIVCEDVTERKRAADALRASEEKSRSLYQMLRLMSDNLPDLVWAKNMEGRYIFANKAMIEKLLIAQDTDEPIGKNDLFFSERQRALHPDLPDWHTFGEICVDSDFVIHTKKYPERFEEFGNVKGKFLFLDVYKAPFLDEQNNMIGTVGIGRDVTHEKKLEEERKQAQEALAASLAELHALFASMQDAVLVIDRDGVYQKVAPTNPNKLYLLPEELIGRKLSDFFPDELVKKFFKVIYQVLETRETVRVEYQLEVKGQSPWFESSVSPMDANTTIWVARDISERKQAETKLRLQSAALEAAANTIVITDRNGIIQWANSAFESLTGFNPSEAIGKNPSPLLKSGKQSREFYEDLWKTILSGNIWHNELINRRKDGSLYFEEMTITPLHDSDNEISHFIAVKQDITERKKAEAQLIESEKEYRTLFENMPIGLYRTAADGRILDANTALVKMFGYPDRLSLMAMQAGDLYAEPDLNNKFKDAIVFQGMLSAFESEFRRYDRQTFWAEDYVHVIRDESGNPLYYEGSLINITDRKKAEDDLRRANRALETAHSELQKMFEHEQGLARTDSLTGQTNRRYFFELATREFTTSIRYNRPLTIILFDIDGFKQVNDTFGHSIGDNILAQVARSTADQVRDVDVLARYGGDEFIILLPETNAEKAFLISERIRVSIASKHLETENSGLAVTLSIGIAEICYAPKDEMIEDVIRRADLALYQAKKNGRNHAVVFKDENAI